MVLLICFAPVAQNVIHYRNFMSISIRIVFVITALSYFLLLTLHRVEADSGLRLKSGASVKLTLMKDIKAEPVGSTRGTPALFIANFDGLNKPQRVLGRVFGEPETGKLLLQGAWLLRPQNEKIPLVLHDSIYPLGEVKLFLKTLEKCAPCIDMERSYSCSCEIEFREGQSLTARLGKDVELNG